MAAFTDSRVPTYPIVSPFHAASMGLATAGAGTSVLSGAVSTAWPTNNLALFYPFRLYDWATAYQLWWWKGSANSGNIDVGIYTSQGNLIVSSGATAMAGTASYIQELNIADTLLPPGDYLLAGACSTTSGTVFMFTSNADEVTLPGCPVYEQTSAMALPSTATPVLSTSATPPLIAIGVQFIPIL